MAIGDETELTDAPPPLNIRSNLGSDQLQTGTARPTREVRVTSGSKIPISEADIVSGSVVEFEGKTPSTAAGAAPSTNTPIARFGYQGTKLVDRNGAVAREQYDPSREAYSFLASMDSGERVGFLRALQSRGLLGKNDVTARFTSSNINATKEFLMYTNYKGVTGDVGLGLFLSDPNIPAVSTGGRIRTTPKEDLRAVFKDTTRKYLGREVSAAEIEKFVNSYIGKEIAEGSGGAAAPSAATAAEVMVQDQFGEEAAAVKALDFMNILDQKIKALG
jgi:hypothetical protein